jgi:hypothetical protein
MNNDQITPGEARIFDLLEVAAEWTADELGPCVGDDDVSSDGVDPATP